MTTHTAKSKQAKESNEDLLKEMKENVERWVGWFSENVQHYKDMFKMVYKSTVSDKERQSLAAVNKPDVEINYMAAYANRLLGEYSHQTPAVSVSGRPKGCGASSYPSGVIDIVEGIIMRVLNEYDKYHKNGVLKQQCVGGFSVLKVGTKYRDHDTFEQDLYLESCDPTLCFFDMYAKMPSKSDGDFCGEIYAMPEKEFKRRYPEHAEDIKKGDFYGNRNFKWYFNDGNQKVVILCDYYKKEYKKTEMVKLANGESMSRSDYNKMKKSWSSIEPIPDVISRRVDEDYEIMRYIFIGKKIIKKEKLKYPKLPYFFVDGNGGPIYDGDSNSSKQATCSYLKNAIGPQKLLNTAAQNVADSMQNLMRSKMLIEKRAVEDPESWQNIHRVAHLQWNSQDDEGNPLPKPEPIVQPDLPSVVQNVFSGMQNVFQNTMGSYDAQLGISDQQLSGVAIEKGATQNNANSIPFAQNYMLSLTDAVDFIVKMIPTICVTGATFPLMNNEGEMGYIMVNQIAEDGNFDVRYPVINYKKDDLQVQIKADYSFELQKDRAINTMIAMMKANPAFAALMQTPEGIAAFMDNLDMRSIDKIKEAAERLQQEAQQAANQPKQPDPAQMQMMLKQQELAQKNQQMQIDAQASLRKIELEEDKLQTQKEIELLKLQEAGLRAAAEIDSHQQDNQAKEIESLIKLEEHIINTNQGLFDNVGG